MHVPVSDSAAVCCSQLKCVCLCALTGEALTQSSLLEADGDNMAASVEPMNLHHAMLRSPGGCLPGEGDPNSIILG